MMLLMFLQIRNVGQQLGIQPTIIRDQELKERGFGGIYGVGQGALHPPALAVLSHTPKGATQNIAWVGKGIVYDTGGLSIKVIIFPVAKYFSVMLTVETTLEYKNGLWSNWIYNVYIHMGCGAIQKGVKIKVFLLTF